ncbi:MAG: glycoside hydrolase family 88 protein [Prevotellaceae bacterium]|nr:glycoside hydrolase family 88 protein [Prevotellaceae bacterium]
MKHLLLCLALICTTGVQARTLPRPSDVLAAMHRANDYFIRQHPDPTLPTFVNKERPSNLWTRGVYYEGLIALNRIDPRPQNLQYVAEWADFHRFTPRNGIYTRDADDYCCCQTYLDLYCDAVSTPSATDKADHMIRPTIQCMDNLLAPAPEHMTPATKTRYGNSSLHDWTWIDAIQMGLPVLTKLTRICAADSAAMQSHALQYAEHGYHMYLWTRDTLAGGLFNTAEGLWWRDKDFVPPYREPNGANCYWSRGNGWVYAALVRAMDDALLYRQQHGTMPAAFHFDDYRADFLRMTNALLQCQRKDAFWNVSLHDPTNFGGKELTGTALFLYGMAWGVRNGLLPSERFTPVIARTWNALVRHCLRRDGFLHYVQGTGKEPKDSQPVAKNHEPDFDDFGLGCFLLAGSEVYQLQR